MNQNILIALCVIYSLLLFIIIFILVFIEKNKNNYPDASNNNNNNILKNGVFFLGTDKNLIYRDTSNNYYLSGTCSSCSSACNIATQIRDVYKTVQYTENGKNGFKNILAQSASSITKNYTNLANGKTLSQYECSTVIDTSNNPASNYINNQISNDFNVYDVLKNGFISIWDFIYNNKDKIIELISQFGTIEVLSKVMGEYACIFLLLPSLLNPDTRLGGIYTITMFSGKAFLLDTLPNILKNMSIDSETIITGSDTALVANEALSTEIVAQVQEKAITESIVEILESISELVDPIFTALGLIMLVGITLDLIDPCGLSDTLSNEQFEYITEAFDRAFFSSLKSNYPFEWFADYIPDYKFNCDYSKDNSDQCKENYQKRLQYTKLYQDSLKQNSLGECIRNLSVQEQNERLSTILGIDVTFPTPNELITNGVFSKFNNVLNYISFPLANNNYIIASYIKQYWYIILIVILLVLLVVFFIN